MGYGFGVQRRGGSAAYSPANFFTGGTAGPWYDLNNSAVVLNGSATSATNGQTIGTIGDSGPFGASATQATDANRPVLATNSLNGRSTATLTVSHVMSASGLDSYLNNASSFTIGAVFNPTDGTTNHLLFRQFDNSFSVNRAAVGFVALTQNIQYTPDTTASFSTSSASSVSAANWHAILYVVDPVAATVRIVTDNAVVVNNVASGKTAGNIANTAGNQSQLFISSCKGSIAEMFFWKNAKMSGAQETAWFAAVKSRFGLTTY
jgi:hypothetical protein